MLTVHERSQLQNGQSNDTSTCLPISVLRLLLSAGILMNGQAGGPTLAPAFLLGGFRLLFRLDTARTVAIMGVRQGRG
jgi:hypothetical protein